MEQMEQRKQRKPNGAKEAKEAKEANGANGANGAKGANNLLLFDFFCFSSFILLPDSSIASCLYCVRRHDKTVASTIRSR